MNQVPLLFQRWWLGFSGWIRMANAASAFMCVSFYFCVTHQEARQIKRPSHQDGPNSAREVLFRSFHSSTSLPLSELQLATVGSRPRLAPGKHCQDS